MPRYAHADSLKARVYPFSGQRLAAGLGASVCRLGKDVRFTKVSIDTRALVPGAVFIALRGKRAGEDFFKEALRAGALALVGRRFDRVTLARAKECGAWCLKVRDGQAALTRLATDQRSLFAGSVLAVTGSVGKTGAKEALARACGAFGPVSATPGNLNNHLGVPLSILGLTPQTKCLVLELGMNHPGELSVLTRLARPNVGIELNVGLAHALNFKRGLVGVALAKEELLSAMRAGGVAVVNGDDPRTAAMGRRFKGRVLRFGQRGSNDLRLIPTVDRGLHGMRARVEWRGAGAVQRGVLNLAQGGIARSVQAGAAIAGGLALGLPLAGLLRALQGWGQGSALRQERRRVHGWNFILDAYNASPKSMAAGLGQLAASAPRGKRVAVLGDMLELGSVTRAAQRTAGRQARMAGVRFLVAVGPKAKWTLEGFGAEGVAFGSAQVKQAADHLRQRLRREDWVLFKGSRGIAVERIANALSAHGG